MGPLRSSGVAKEKAPNPQAPGGLPGALIGPRVLIPHAPASGGMGAPGDSAALGALWGRRGLWGPEGPQGAPGTSPRGRCSRGRGAPRSGGPKERRGPCALGGTAAGQGARGRGVRPGDSWGSAVLVTLREREGKGPEPPGTWGASGGPQGTPGPFPSRPRLWTSRGPTGYLKGPRGAPRDLGPCPPSRPVTPPGEPRGVKRGIGRSPGGVLSPAPVCDNGNANSRHETQKCLTGNFASFWATL